MKKDVYLFSDYKKYVLHRLEHYGGKQRGLKSRLAETAGVKAAYISQVLDGGADFSLEQAEALNDFFSHNDDEAEYFLLLVQWARAGSAKLKSRFQKRIDTALEKRLEFKERVDIKTSLEPLEQATYYSAWYFAAIHILVGLKDVQTFDQIKKHLLISDKKLQSALEFLVRVGLLNFNGKTYSQNVSRLFLGRDSAFVNQHHANWRNQAIASLSRNDEKDLHFTTIVSVNKKDILKIKEILAKGIDDARSIVKESQHENTVGCLAVDFFELF
jgi:uncharacterized protein (TIGR02147 family)